MKKSDQFKGTQFYGSLNYIGASILNLDCDIIDLAMINTIEDISSLRFTEKDLYEGQFVFKLNWRVIPKRLPFLPCKSRSSIFSRLEKLEKLCLIERVEKKSNEMWFKWGGRFDDFKNAKDLEVEEITQDSESGKLDSVENRVRQTGLSESGKLDSGESGTVDSIIGKEYTSLEYTFKSEHEAPPEKNQPDVKIENEEIEVIAPEPDLYEYAGLVKELGKLKDDTPANRVMALRLYEVHIQGEYFQDSWQYLSGYSGVPPGVVMKEWIMKGVWHEIKEARYNKIGNWIKVQKRISKEENQKNGKIFSEEKLRALDRELDSLGY